jgi:hypothetical protein
MIVKTRIRIAIDYNKIPYNANMIVQDELSQVLMRLLPLPIPQTKQDPPFYQQKKTAKSSKINHSISKRIANIKQNAAQSQQGFCLRLHLRPSKMKQYNSQKIKKTRKSQGRGW